MGFSKVTARVEVRNVLFLEKITKVIVPTPRGGRGRESKLCVLRAVQNC